MKRAVLCSVMLISVILGALTVAVRSSATTGSPAKAKVVSVRPAKSEKSPVGPKTEWVTLRLAYDHSATYSCSIVLRHADEVVGRSGFRGPVPGGGVSIPIEIAGSEFVGKPSDATVRCSVVSVGQTGSEASTTVPMGG